MDLQNVFYTMAIIYMSIMFIIMIVVVVAIFVIKHKIHLIQRSLEEKFQAITNAIHVGENIVGKAREAFGKRR